MRSGNMRGWPSLLSLHNRIKMQSVCDAGQYRTVWQGEVLLSAMHFNLQQPMHIFAGQGVVGNSFSSNPALWPSQLVRALPCVLTSQPFQTYFGLTRSVLLHQAIEKLIDYRSPGIADLTRKFGAAVQGRFLPRPDSLTTASVGRPQHTLSCPPDMLLGYLPCTTRHP